MNRPPRIERNPQRTRQKVAGTAGKYPNRTPCPGGRLKNLGRSAVASKGKHGVKTPVDRLSDGTGVTLPFGKNRFDLDSSLL